MAQEAWRVLAAVAFMAGLAVSSGVAQTPQQIDWCSGKSGATLDQMITGCTAMIDKSSRYCILGLCLASTPELVGAFANRGMAYAIKGEYDRAIADFDEAIRLNPNIAQAFVNRGEAYRNKNEFDRAIADFDQAIRLNPNFAPAFNNRGFAYVNKGENDRAIADFDQAIRLNPNLTLAFRNRGRANFLKGDFSAAAADFLRANDAIANAYGMLWRFLAQGRIGQDGAAELLANAALLKTKDWPYPVIEYYLGQRPLNQLLAAASKPDERCETAFYLGQWRLLRGNKVEAKVALLNAADTCPKDFAEYIGAVAELKRLNQ
jgi:lipoprotein NlpI